MFGLFQIGIVAAIAMGIVTFIGWVRYDGRQAGRAEVKAEIAASVSSTNEVLRAENARERAELEELRANRRRLEEIAVAKGLAVRNDMLVLPDDVVDHINRIGRR